ncbi:MAG: FAD-dependent oxidoreductase, partial [Bdellovibrionales bacterium]
EPQASQQFQNGLFLNLEAHLDPRKTMRALCEFLQNEESITLIEDPTSNIQHPTSIVIDCRGMAADDPDLRGVKGETLRVRNPEFSLSRPVRIMHPRYPLYIIPREDHVFMVGATVIESADTKTSLRSAMELMSALYTLHPSFGDAEVLEIKAGIRPSYPDNLPRIIINENRISCNGLFRHGFLLAPVMAECVKDYLNDEENQFMPLFQRTKNEDHTQRAA